jgi:hypothetical protein
MKNKRNYNTPYYSEKNLKRKNQLKKALLKYNKSKHGSLIRKQYTLSVKILVLQVYSKGTMRCKKCGFDNLNALSIDHIKGGGSRHRKKLNTSGIGFYRWLRDNKYPSGFQVLCMNCQWLKRMGEF